MSSLWGGRRVHPTLLVWRSTTVFVPLSAGGALPVKKKEDRPFFSLLVLYEHNTTQVVVESLLTFLFYQEGE